MAKPDALLINSIALKRYVLDMRSLKWTCFLEGVPLYGFKLGTINPGPAGHEWPAEHFWILIYFQISKTNKSKSANMKMKC
jgi:hypothetical protein